MITQKFALPILLVLITDATAIFYFLKDQKHHHEEVDHHHHNHHHHDEYMHHMHKHHDEHKHHEHKPHHMHKHHEEHKPHHMHNHHEEHNPHHMHKHHEEHKHHEHKHQHMHKHQEEHKHHQHHHHGHHHEEHKHEHKDHHDHHHHHEHHKHERQPHYEFKYGVRDPSTGDIKNQWEMRKGDDVKGEYSLVEADGTIRTVQYTAGKHTGFNAIVKKEGKAKHPIFMAPRPVLTHQKSYPGSEIKGKSSGLFEDVDSSEVDPYSPSNLPTNHKAVFSGIDEKSNLLSLYKNHPVNYVHGNEQRGFDYGINEYLTKRSYDLSRITDMLNAAPTIDPIRAVRGTFVMGR